MCIKKSVFEVIEAKDFDVLSIQTKLAIGDFNPLYKEDI